MTGSLLKLMTPILSFTAEEAWRVFHGTDTSIMLETRQALPAPQDEEALLDKWEKIRACRAKVMKALEDLRVTGKIGAALEAEVKIWADGEIYELLYSLGDDLKFVFICSKTTLTRSAEDKIECVALDFPKCVRCWHVCEDVGMNPDHPSLCARCLGNLYGKGEARACA
jgi:isoleucyl-tRNA synthetase